MSTTLGKEHPIALTYTNAIGILHREQEDDKKAEPLMLGAHNGRQIKLGPEHPHTIESLKQLVTPYEAWNRPGEAAQWRAKLPPNEAIEE